MIALAVLVLPFIILAVLMRLFPTKAAVAPADVVAEGRIAG